MKRDRILVWGLSNNKAGTEAVIYNYASRMPEAHFDFLCYEEPLSYSKLFQSGNNRFFTIPIKIKSPVNYSIALRQFINKHGAEYHTLWCNLNDISNIDILKQAKKAGIPRRIAHFHNSEIPNAFITKLFTTINRQQFLQITTDYWACSSKSGLFAYGDNPFVIIPNAIDPLKVSFDEKKRTAVRARLHIEDQHIICAVGRLEAQKNHQLLIKALPGILKKRPNTTLIIVGEGQLLNSLISLAKQYKVEKKVIFCGSQTDIQAYLSASDCFAMPSLYEGLSISLLEAQFNGLPCITSDTTTSESVVSTNVIQLPLDSVKDWADELSKDSTRDNRLLESSTNYNINNAMAFFRKSIASH